MRGQNYFNTINLETTGEKALIELFQKYNNVVNPIVFDCGAHKGEFTDLFSNTSNYKFYLFEPQKDCANFCKAKYKDRPNIKVIESATGLSKSDDVDLYIAKENTLFALTYEFDFKLTVPHLTIEKSQNCTMLNLYEYCLNHEIKTIDYLKLDVEGHELDCIRTLLPMINTNSIPFIQFEYSFVNLMKKELFIQFWDVLNVKYNLYRIIANGIFKINKYNLTLEQASPINYLAVLKTEEFSVYY